MSEAGGGGAPRLLPLPFWYLRHGQTDWNARDLAQGVSEVPLNETGRAQAREAARRLLGRDIRSMVASPLGRAQETARIVAGVLGLADFATEPLLREAAFGEKEGRPMAGWFEDWVLGRLTPAGAESFAALQRRAAEGVNRALGHPAPVLVVAHGSLFRALRAVMGLTPLVRLPNAVPVRCVPDTPAWRLEEA